MKNILLFFFFISVVCHSAQGQSDTIEKPKKNWSCEEGMAEAEKHAEKGYYWLPSYGLVYYQDYDFQKFYEDFLIKNYGIITGNQGCVVFEEQLCYNKRMKELIHKKFGDDIFEKVMVEAHVAYEISMMGKPRSGYIFSDIDTLPAFPGGYDSLYLYLSNKLSGLKAKNGVVYASFVVEKDGSISDIELQNKYKPGVDKEIVNALSKMPLWEPGAYYGHKVRVKLTIPIEFKS